jgi:hypothetical protein
MAGAALVLALSGCGVSASSQPRDLGAGYTPNAGPNFAQAPAEPTAADPIQLVKDYLDAAAGGNEAAVNQVRQFLTDNGRKSWAAPDKNATGSILIIHVTDVATAAQTDSGTPVDLSYREVGTLNDQDGRITPSTNTAEQKRRLQVVRAADQLGQLRIDSGALPGLVLRDDALNGTYYRPQPIYFWDASNQVLVPDLRYVPLTVPPDTRAFKIVGWLQHGPSQLLGSDAVNTLPNNTSYTVATRDSTLVIKLSPQAGGKGPDDARRLVYQLQASLLPVTGRDLEVWIGNSEVPPTGSSDYRQYDLSSALPVPMQKYDIIDGVVKPLASDSAGVAPDLQMLAAKENSAVAYAAISRDDAVGAFVRATDPSPSLVLVPNSGKVVTVRGLPRTDQVSRPAWIPGIDGLLIAWGGGLYLVDLNGQATLMSTPGLGAITEVTVSPDGRRVAMMAGGQVTVAVLLATNTPNGPSVHLDGQPQILQPDPGLTPYAVSWDSEQQVNIVGRGANGKSALWLVTTDGAVATDLTNALKDVNAVDVVSYPKGAFSRDGETVVLTPDPTGPYRVGSPGVVPDGTHKPFYVD